MRQQEDQWAVEVTEKQSPKGYSYFGFLIKLYSNKLHMKG